MTAVGDLDILSCGFPAMADKYPMTPRGLVLLKDELKQRKEVERPRIVRAIEEARAHGDLSENAEYSAAKEAQSHNEGRIGKLEELIGLADVIDPATLSGKKVVFGAPSPSKIARAASVRPSPSSARTRLTSNPGA